MERWPWVLIAGLGVAFLAACGRGEVIVQAATIAEGGEATALQDLEVVLLPFDRDQVFDSLAAAYSEPEPPIPDTLLRLQDAVARAHEAWTAAEARWTAVRDSLAALSGRMQRMSRSQVEYAALFRAFAELRPEEDRLRRQSDAAFARFDRLQNELVARSQEVALRRDAWEAAAFASVDSIFAALLEQTGRGIVADTTDATGAARIRVPPGRWWVHARYELPRTELYWNIPVDVARGGSVRVELSRETAEVRRKL
ncbi:MAG TPA: hypothetical protein VF158_13300 [Longimicrobiales bacterium]